MMPGDGRRILNGSVDDREPPVRAALSRPDRSRCQFYITSVPFVALIVWVPDDEQSLPNVEPPVKVMVSAISCVHWYAVVELPPE